VSNTFPHYCAMDHIPIGHSDSGDDERCPLCRMRDQRDHYVRLLIKTWDGAALLAADVMREDGDAVCRRAIEWLENEGWGCETLPSGAPSFRSPHEAFCVVVPDSTRWSDAALRIGDLLHAVPECALYVCGLEGAA
jgi:hypothetical protein